MENPVDKILNSLLIAELRLFQSLIAEEKEWSWQYSSGIVESLNSSSECDGGSSFDGNFALLIFGEGGGFSFDEIIKLIIFIVD